MPVSEGSNQYPSDNAGKKGLGTYDGTNFWLWRGDNHGHAGVLLYDLNNNPMFSGPYDPAAGAGQKWRGSNVSGGFADGRVHLVDVSGNDIGSGFPNADNTTGLTIQYGLTTLTAPYRWNESTWDRERGNTAMTVLASAARTATINSPVLTNYNARGAIAFLNVTAASGTGGLQLSFFAQDPVSGNTPRLAALPTAVTATGIYSYLLYPGASGTAPGGSAYLDQIVSAPLPRNFLIGILAGDSSSYTYSVGLQLIV